MSHHDKHDQTNRWHVEIDLTSSDHETIAVADLFVGDRVYEASGTSRSEPFASEVAKELAVARALSNVAHQLVDDVSRRVDRAARAVSTCAEDAGRAYADIDT